MPRMMSCKRTEDQNMTMEPALASEEVIEPWGFIDLMEGDVAASQIKDTYVVDTPKVSIGRDSKNTLRFHDLQVSRNQYEITCSKKNDDTTRAEIKNISTRKNCRLNGQELRPNATLELLNNDVFTVCTMFNLRWRYYNPKNASKSLDPSKPNLPISVAKSIYSNRPPSTEEEVVKPSSEPPVVSPLSQAKMKDIDIRKAVLKNETHKLVQKAKGGSSSADGDSINGGENGNGRGDEPGDPNSTFESDGGDLMQFSASDVSQEVPKNNILSQPASDKDILSTSSQEVTPTSPQVTSAPTSKTPEVVDEEDEMSAIEKEMQKIIKDGQDGIGEEIESKSSQPIEKADVMNFPSPGPMSMSYSSTTVEVGDGEQDEIDEREYNQEKSIFGQDEGIEGGDESILNETRAFEPRTTLSSLVFHEEDTQLIVPPTPTAEEEGRGVPQDPRSNSLSSEESVSLLDDSRVFANDGDSTEMIENGRIEENEENNEESKTEDEEETPKFEDVQTVNGSGAPASKIVGPTPKRTRGLGSPASTATPNPSESPPVQATPRPESDKEEVAVEKPESPSKMTRKRGQSIPPEEGVKKTKILAANNQVKVNDFNLGELLLTDGLFDGSLMVGDREFKIHKAVLSCQSTLFREEFAKGTPSNLSLPKLKADAFEIALRFAYFGGFKAEDDHLSGSELVQILGVAEKCGMKLLKEATIRRIFNLQEINPEIGMNLVEIVSGGDSDELLDRVLNLVKPIYSEIKKLAKWKEIVFEPKHLKMIQRLVLILDR